MSKGDSELSGIYGINRRRFIKYGSLSLAAGMVAACSNSSQKGTQTKAKGELDKVNFGISWVAEAEYGGFYQAVATDIYKQHGLDVTIKQGGPRINGNALLLGGAVDFYMGQGVDAIKAVEAGIPKVTVAAIFQKEIQILIAHPGRGNDSLEKLKGKPIFVSSTADNTYWPVLKSKYGFTDEQKRPYNFNLGPFLADKNVIQQGLLTAEPFTIEKQSGFKPVVIPLADYGYNPYSFTIETTRQMVETKPDLVERVVKASIEGWYSYLEDPKPGNQLIKQANPEMTDEQIAYSLQKLKEYNIITSGDAVTLGIGAMTNSRWETLFKDLVKVGVFKPDTDYKKAYTLQFVNKGVDYYKS